MKHYNLKDMTDEKMKKSQTKLGELEAMTTEESNDEPFFLSLEEIIKVLVTVHKQKPPDVDTWDKYSISFYIKMCGCVGVDWKDLDDAGYEIRKKRRKALEKEQDEKFKQEIIAATKEKYLNGPKVDPQLLNRPLNTEMSEREKCFYELIGYERPPIDSMPREEQELWERIEDQPFHIGPYTFGSYSSGSTPQRIPYHLYLLVKKAVDIMNPPSEEGQKAEVNMTELNMVEDKIEFFCTYFHAHLPTDWNYDRKYASALIADYDTTTTPRYNMADYTPFVDVHDKEYWSGFNHGTRLSKKDMVDIIRIIHSRKTPEFSTMEHEQMAFYCKICSCFLIDYNNLEAASDEAVCLLDMGRKTD